MVKTLDSDHPILAEAWKHQVISFRCEGEGDERHVDLGLRHRETHAITNLRFLGVKDVYFSDAPDSQGLEILDVASRQLEGVSVQVANFENAPDRVRLFARSVVKLDGAPAPDSSEATAGAPRSALPIPPAVEQSPDAKEVLRLWVDPGGAQHLVALPYWSDPAAWGLALVDLARHISRAYEAGGGPVAPDALARLRQGFDAEWSDPTDDPKGGPLGGGT